ncbi:unnamed protein product, partial [Didymodactylos carnosus]
NYQLNDQAHSSGCCSKDEDGKRQNNLGVTHREDWYIKLSTATNYDTNTGVVFNPTVTLSYPGPINYGGCKCDDTLCTILKTFWNMDTGDIIIKVQNFIQEQVNSGMKSVSAGDIYAPYYGIAIRYLITSAALRNIQDIRAYISVVVYALELRTQQWLIYEDHDQERNLLYPPL